ncbi:MAG: relaxase, partial [Eubacterium sp.]|nr:relaxase [Eubacterium sp.]
EDFASLLLREGVTVKESRGRLSYLTPDRTKPITARKLGDDFDRTAVLAVLEQNAQRAMTQAVVKHDTPARSERGVTNRYPPKNDSVQRMVDIAAKRAEGKGRGYEKWATMHNLKQMAATVAIYQQYGFSSPEELDKAYAAAHADMQESLAGLKPLEAVIADKKELQRNLLSYISTKPARDGLKAQKSDKARRAYREQHESDFIIAEAATRYFKEHGIKKLPSRKALQEEIQTLTVQKNAGYNDYREKRQRAQELQTVKRNIDQILRRDEPQRRKEQSHER